MVPDGLSVVVPVFNTRQSLTELVLRTREACAGLGPLEILLVDDGSSTPTWNQIQQLSGEFNFVRGMRLGRNFGQHNALLAGIRAAQMPTIVTIDDDLQNPPEEIPRLLEQLQSGEYDVVYGVPDRVEQSFFRRVAGRLTRWSLKSGLGVNPALNVSSFRIFNTNIRESFANDLGTNVSVDALLSWGSSRFGAITVKHDQRKEGKSNYSFGKLLRFAIDTTTGYSTVPLQIASVLGLATAGFGLCILFYVTIRPLVTGESVPGFPFLAATIAILSGAQLTTLGVMGEYLARMHFRIMRKPTYVVSEVTQVSDIDPL